MEKTATNSRLIENDKFPFEFISQLAERESWRKEIHRPIYHMHKWWAMRLGSVFRGILLGCALSPEEDLEQSFYEKHSFSHLSVFDPFMGSGTTVGEAHKLGFTAFGRDINPVAVESVKVALGPLSQRLLQGAFNELSEGVGEKLRNLYRSNDSRGNPCDVLYHFWVMQVTCPGCHDNVDLFPSWIIGRNAYPSRKPEIEVLCRFCGELFRSIYGQAKVECEFCGKRFSPENGVARGSKATCRHCGETFSVLKAIAETGRKPGFRLYGKLVLTNEGEKEYLKATAEDYFEYNKCSDSLKDQIKKGGLSLPALTLEDGYNTRQAINYGFREWKDFFNDRQLLGLSWLQNAIKKFADESVRNTFLVLFSGLLEFNNMFVSYKGEGTGAVRHMFSHHILKPERLPIEANIWGTPKSSGAFSNLVMSRLMRAIEYRLRPMELNRIKTAKGLVCSAPFTGKIEPQWPVNGSPVKRGIYLSQGDSSMSELLAGGIDLVVTDPPFFDNVHYSELADFFYAWQQIEGATNPVTTRNLAEVQDSDSEKFAEKLGKVFEECHRVLKDEGLLVFTYHHSRGDGWKALARAIFDAGFVVVNSHPVKSEMSVATPKAQAKEPIQLDIIIVCRKANRKDNPITQSIEKAFEIARSKIRRLQGAGFSLSQNDIKIIYYGHFLTTTTEPADVEAAVQLIQNEIASLSPAKINLQYKKTYIHF